MFPSLEMGNGIKRDGTPSHVRHLSSCRGRRSVAQPTCALQAGGLPAKLTHVMVWFMNCYCYSEYYNYFFLDWVEGVKAI